MPTHATGSVSTTDGLTLFTQHWLPNATPRGLIVLTHGLGEHSGRYARHAAAFTAADFAVFGYDLRGHGQSDGPRGHTPTFGHFLDDLSLVIATARGITPDGPLVVLGHSLGGLITANYALDHADGLDAVILTSPYLALAFAPPALVATLARAAASFLPAMQIGNQLDVTGLSRVPDVVQAYQDDPLVHDRISLSLANTSLSLGATLTARAAEFQPPLLIQHGTADRLTSPTASRAFFDAVAHDRKHYIAYDGWYHELHNEAGYAEVFVDMLTWLNTVLPD